jgi:hypothetical protein
MTTNYQESTVAGTKWKRANTIAISNPLNQLPNASISFSEEEVIQLGTDDYIKKETGVLSEQFSNIVSFDILNPTTGAVVGSMTPLELYVALYSLYMYLAQERDSA